MRIQRIEIGNYRKLENVRIDISENTTLFVGANNSGKTSAIDAIKHFLDDHSFKLSDFTVSNLPRIRDIGKGWEEATDTKDEGSGEVAEFNDQLQTLEEWTTILPHLDVWISAAEQEVHRASELLPLLDDYSGGVGVRLRLQPRDVQQLARDYLSARKAVESTRESEPDEEKRPRLNPMNLAEFLEGKLSRHFHVVAYRLNPYQVEPNIDFGAGPVGIDANADAEDLPGRPQAVGSESKPIGISAVRRLIKVDTISAQRWLENHDSASTLSSSIASYYREHLDFTDHPMPEDLGAIRATQDASKIFDDRLQQIFEPPLEEVSQMGYPGNADPKPIIRTNLTLTDGLERESVLRYSVAAVEEEEDAILFELSEGMNGLGYQNLVLMIFRLMGFRDQWLRRGKLSQQAHSTGIAPIHLVFIEEPEAHLHPQVQQVFINQAYKTLTAHMPNDSDNILHTQLLVSTHSSHIAHELDFAGVRYFRRGMAGRDTPVPTTTVKNLATVFGNDDETARFVKRYLQAHHCNLFFADAAILVEGAAERILLPKFVADQHPRIAQCYVEYLDVGGAHAHRLRNLIMELGIPTLVITDLDAQAPDGTKARPRRGAGQVTGSNALRLWLNTERSIDKLLVLDDESKVARTGTGSAVRFAYQLEVKAPIDSERSVQIIPSTFEDALAADNLRMIAELSSVGLLRKFSDSIKAAIDDQDGSNLAEELYGHIKGGDKAGFALELLLVLEDGEKIVAPKYISDGLKWLEGEVGRLPVLPSAEISSENAEDAEPA